MFRQTLRVKLRLAPSKHLIISLNEIVDPLEGAVQRKASAGCWDLSLNLCTARCQTWNKSLMCLFNKAPSGFRPTFCRRYSTQFVSNKIVTCRLQSHWRWCSVSAPCSEFNLCLCLLFTFILGAKSLIITFVICMLSCMCAVVVHFRSLSLTTIIRQS